MSADRLFAAYIMVDWSAASKPATGPDSIWIGVMRRDVRFRPVFESHNPATRREAEALLTKLMAEFAKSCERVLVGFDFPLGYPRGLAHALGLEGTPWTAIWALIEKTIKDRPDNVNNRFSFGADLNRKLTGTPFPFWGCAARDAQKTLTIKRFREHTAKDLPEFRLCEQRLPGTQSPWKLHYNGSVGGQALTGIPVAARLRSAHPGVAVWPFDLGMKPIGVHDLNDITAVFTEIWPSQIKPELNPGEIKDQAQVRTLCEHYLKLDEAGRLGSLFAGPALPDDDSDAVMTEEGWILGV
jgi:hypothetical protein